MNERSTTRMNPTHIGQRLKSACAHIYVRAAGSLVIDRPHELLLPPRPRISVLTGCRVLAQVHLYAGARYIVVRVLGPEC